MNDNLTINYRDHKHKKMVTRFHFTHPYSIFDNFSYGFSQKVVSFWLLDSLKFTASIEIHYNKKKYY